MTFLEKWATMAFVAGLPLVWATAVAQQEANVLGEMPPLWAFLTAFVMIGFAGACAWAAVERD